MEVNASQKVTCIVNYPYDASEPDELSIRPGDVLREVDRLPGGWWRGELRGKRGMFPDNFVSVLTTDNNDRSSGVQGRCRAVFSYQPANPDELPLCVGDVLDVLGEVEEGWWQGRRQGRIGVFPSNFVVMLDPHHPAAVPFEPAPALPPKPVKEQCRVLFPYAAVNDDELTLSEGELVTIVSKDAPDRGWWRGELRGKVGLFPDNFVQLLPAALSDAEEKKPERPPSKTGIYPVLNKYSEKTSSVKELSTSKISLHKENTLSKDTQSTVTHTNRSESEKVIHTESITDGVDGQIKKPPVPLKKSPTPSTGVGSLLSGLKNKMMPSSDKTEKSSIMSSSGSSSGELDKTDGGAGSKPAANNDAKTNTLDVVERNSILNDPRAGRVKAPRRRPPSQVLRDDTPAVLGLSNGHEDKSTTEKAPASEKAEEIKPRAREWEKHRAPWMEELKLNQAKKTITVDGKTRSSSSSEGGVASKAGSGSTDRLLDCGVEEKKSSHSIEMSKSTSSISSRISVMESFDEQTKTRHSLDSKKEDAPAPTPSPNKPTLQSPTAAGRTFTTMLDEIKKSPAPTPPTTAPPADLNVKLEKLEKSPSRMERSIDKLEHRSAEKSSETAANFISKTSSLFEKTSTLERLEKTEDKLSNPTEKSSNTLERRIHSLTRRTEDKSDADALISQLNNRISNLEKLLEVQNAKFTAAIEELNTKLKLESEKRQALQAELDKLAHCVTQV